VLFLSDPAFAGTAAETIRDSFAEANRVLHDPVTDGRPVERLNAIRDIVHRIFDSREAGERSLGREWQARTLAEQAEFVRLFAKVIEWSFVTRVASMVDLQGDVRIGYRGETVDRTSTTVLTMIVGRDGRQVPVEYRMTLRGDHWMVRDMVIGGVSLVANYRAQFYRVIRRTSYDFLVARMKARIVIAPTATATVSGSAGAATWPSSGTR
jgi:phospholipid transport system substrate-binding protein